MSTSDILALIFGIFGSVTGLIGLFISILSYNHNKIETLNLYFIQARDEFLMEGKKIIYDLAIGQVIDTDCKTDTLSRVSHVINFYHHWGLMVKHNQLPFWIFYDNESGLTSSGIAVIRTYEQLKPTIKKRRKNNEKYAEYYEWLYNELKDKTKNNDKEK